MQMPHARNLVPIKTFEETHMYPGLSHLLVKGVYRLTPLLPCKGKIHIFTCVQKNKRCFVSVGGLTCWLKASIASRRCCQPPADSIAPSQQGMTWQPSITCSTQCKVLLSVLQAVVVTT